VYDARVHRAAIVCAVLLGAARTNAQVSPSAPQPNAPVPVPSAPVRQPNAPVPVPNAPVPVPSVPDPSTPRPSAPDPAGSQPVGPAGSPVASPTAGAPVPPPPPGARPLRGRPSEAEQADRALAEEQCANHEPSCDWLATLSTLERDSLLRALAARGYQLDAAPWGKVIGALRVYNEDVFAESTTPLRGLLNYFHITTKESTIRAETVVEAGERWDQARIDETARRLRDPLWTSVVAVVPVVAAAPDTVDVLIVTRDIWSLRLNTQYTFQQGSLTNLSMSLSENNFLGKRDLVAVAMTMDQGAIAVGPLFIDKNLAGEHLDFRAQLNDVLTRDDLLNHGRFHSEGTTSAFSLTRPLWSLSSEWAAGASFSHRYAIDRQYVGTQLRTFQSIDPATQEPTVFERQYKMRKWTASAFVTRQWGDQVKSQLSIGHTVDLQRPQVLDDAPEDPAARADFVAHVLPRSEVTSAPFIEYALFTPRYRTLRNVTTFALAEDLRTGPDLDVSLGFGLEALGSDHNFERLNSTAGWTIPVTRDGFVRLSTALSGRYQQGGTIDNTATWAVRAAAPPVAGLVRFMMQSSLSTHWNNTQNQFFVIGSDSGLRGFAINEFTGQRFYDLQVEARSLPTSLWVLRLGGVAFYDLGGASRSLNELELHQDAGVGLRMLIPQASAQLWKFDFAVPFDGTNRGHVRFLAGFGSEF
jgi:hypothetical protein